VRLEHAETLHLDTDRQSVWAFLWDVPRVVRCMPQVSEFSVVEPDRVFAAIVADRVGLFVVRVPVRIQISAVEPLHRIEASVNGRDHRDQANVRGLIEARIEASDAAQTDLTLSVHLEVIGKLATVGAIPIRHRMVDLFDKFGRNVQADVTELTAGRP
jgi:carbon monoxide dehydrogenase subunit G